MLVKLTTFTGKVPRLPDALLPDNGAAQALNCDFLHGELRSHHDWLLKSQLSTTVIGEKIVDVWSENGADFFGWPWEVQVVKSPVADDQFSRIYYTGLPSTGAIIKVARTKSGSVQVINGIIPNFQPPESINPFTGDSHGNDGQAWALGVPAPEVLGVGPQDAPELSLFELPSWPSIPNLQLKVTYFLEDPAGNIVYQVDISNSEAAIQPNNRIVYPQVFYTNDDSQRGNMIQDMLWPLSYSPQPYKFYWFEKPPFSAVTVARTVDVINSDPGKAIAISYGESAPSPADPNPTPPGGGSDHPGDEA